jgi:hypothetical protein
VVVGIASLSSRGAVAWFEKPGTDQRLGNPRQRHDEGDENSPHVCSARIREMQKLALNLTMLRM